MQNAAVAGGGVVVGGVGRLRSATIVALGFVVACLLLIGLAPAVRPVYALEGQLVLTPPNYLGQGNALRAQDASVVFFAAAVEREYNGRPSSARVSSPLATLYGTGVRDGSRVSLVDRGGQWQSSFDRPYLRVEVVAPSAAEADRRFAQIVSRLEAIAEDRQRAARVPLRSTVTLELVPAAPRLQVVGGSSTRGLVASLLLTALGFLGILSAGGRLAARRRRASTRADDRLHDVDDALLGERPAAPADRGSRLPGALV